MLDDNVVVAADEVVVVVDVVEKDVRDGGGCWMLGPVGNEDEGAGSGIRRVHALFLMSRLRAGAGVVGGVMCGTCWCSRVVPAARVSGLSEGGGPLQLQEVWVCLLGAVEAAEEASLDAGHVLFHEVGVLLGGGVWVRPEQGHEAGCHHVLAEMHGGGAWGGGSHAVQGGFPLLRMEGDLSRPPLCRDLQGPLGPFRKAMHRPTKVLVAAADGEQRVQGPAPSRAPVDGAVRLVLPGVCVRVSLCGGGGGVVGGEEGVGAMDHPGAGRCVVVGGGEGFRVRCT